MKRFVYKKKRLPNFFRKGTDYKNLKICEPDRKLENIMGYPNVLLYFWKAWF